MRIAAMIYQHKARGAGAKNLRNLGLNHESG
jgi:hypothetical protein